MHDDGPEIAATDTSSAFFDPVAACAVTGAGSSLLEMLPTGHAWYVPGTPSMGKYVGGSTIQLAPKMSATEMIAPITGAHPGHSPSTINR